MENKIDGLWIPIEILQDSNLTPNEKLVLSIVKSLDQNRGCFASNQYIANLLGLEKRSITAIVSKLKTKGYIDVTVTGYNQRKIVVVNNEQEKDNIVSIDDHKQKETCDKKQDKNNTPKVSKKVKMFNSLEEHDWDWEDIDKLEREYIDRKLRGEII